LHYFDEIVDKDMMSLDMILMTLKTSLEVQILLISNCGNSTHTWVASTLEFNGESITLEWLKYLTRDTSQRVKVLGP